MDLHFEVHGQGEPLIILHGLFGSLDNWRSISARLAHQFKVYCLDQRNHGRSPHTFAMDYTLMAEDVRELLLAQQLDNAFILGHSMGGKTAMQLALLHPGCVKKLVIVDIAPRAYSPRHERIISGMLSLDLGNFQTRKEMEAALAPAVPDVATRQFLLKNIVRTGDNQFAWRLGLEELKKNYARLIEPVSSNHSFYNPALFLRGEKSDYLFESDYALIQRLFPNVLFKTIPEAEHLLHVEKPELFVKLVEDFLVEPERQ